MVCSLEDYQGGKLGLNVYNSSSSFNNIKLKEIDTLTFDGNDDLVIGEFKDLVKIVNISDNSYRLSENDYSYDDNILSLSNSYLRTLDVKGEYTFRVVTVNGFYDIKVKTSFIGASVTSEKTEYENSDSIIVNITDAAIVKAVYIDNMKIDSYEVKDNVLTIGNEVVSNLTLGNHTLTIYTDNGRPSYSFKINETFDYVVEEEKSNHLFFYIDIAIFGGFILGYCVFFFFVAFL